MHLLKAYLLLFSFPYLQNMKIWSNQCWHWHRSHIDPTTLLTLSIIQNMYKLNFHNPNSLLEPVSQRIWFLQNVSQIENTLHCLFQRNHSYSWSLGTQTSKEKELYMGLVIVQLGAQACEVGAHYTQPQGHLLTLLKG